MADESIYNLNYIKYLFILTTIILIPIIFEFALRNKSVFDKTYLCSGFSIYPSFTYISLSIFWSR